MMKYIWLLCLISNIIAFVLTYQWHNAVFIVIGGLGFFLNWGEE